MGVLNTPISFYDYPISDTLAYNLKSWLEYGLIEMGAYSFASFDGPASGLTRLQRTYDPQFGDGRVYEYFGPSIIWQSGVDVPAGNVTPYYVSGIYIDGIPHSVDDQSIPYYIDYDRGRCIFSSGIPASSVVESENFFNDVSIYLADDPKWKRTINDLTDQFSNLSSSQPSGLSSILKENRLYMPCVVIDVKSRNKSTGLQLGGGQINDWLVVFHVFSEEPHARRQLTDLLSDQQDKVLKLFDVNKITPPFRYNGSLNPSGQMTYPNLVNNYFATNAHIYGTKFTIPAEEFGVYTSKVYMNLNVPRYLLY